MDDKLFPNETPVEPAESSTNDVAPENNQEPTTIANNEAPAPQENTTVPQNSNLIPPFQYKENAPGFPGGNQENSANNAGAIQGAPINPVTNEEKKQKKGKLGKVIFTLLICACLIVSSVAIITREDSKTNVNSSNSVTNDNLDKDPQGPVSEDSPLSYSEYSGEGSMTAEQVYEAVKDINVGVLVYSQNQMVSEGSGIVFSKDSSGKYTYVLTAAHVIADTNITVQVQFNDETEVDADIIGLDRKTDIGVLRIKGGDYKTAVLGNSDKLSVGQKVYAIGNPGGTEFFGSFTSGMVSAIDRPVPTTNSSYDLPCIQHNAAINPGNSGGALVNEYGQVIGLNSSKISSTEYEGMGFAVPSNTLREIYTEIVKNGYVSNRPMLGIQYYPVSSDPTYSQIAWKNDLPYGSIVIASINETSDLYNKGVEIGDIVTAVNGKDLQTTDVLLEIIENGKINDKLVLTIYRLNNNGTVNKTFKVTVKLIEDRGQNVVVPEETTQTDPYGFFFGE